MTFDLNVYTYLRKHTRSRTREYAQSHIQAHLKLSVTDQNDSLQLFPDLPTRGDMSRARSLDDFPDESTYTYLPVPLGVV